MPATTPDKLRDVLAEHGLDKYLDRPVTRVAIDVSSTGHGLAEAVGVDPVVVLPGETVYVVFECELAKHDHAVITAGKDKVDTGEWALVFALKAGSAAVLTEADAPEIQAVIRAAQERAEKVREEKDGIQRLDYDLADAHQRGEHADGRVDGCAPCELEAALEKTEAVDPLPPAADTGTDPEWETAPPPEPGSIADELAKARSKREGDEAAPVAEPEEPFYDPEAGVRAEAAAGVDEGDGGG